MTKKRLLGHTFVKKKKNEFGWFLGSLERPLGRPWVEFWANKKGNEKNNKKKDGRRKASAGTADPARRDFGRKNWDTNNSTRPQPILGDGRADDGKRVPTRLKLNLRPLGPWGEVQEGGPPGRLGAHSDDGKRALSAIEVEGQAARPI